MRKACDLAPAVIDLRFQLACLLSANNGYADAAPHFQYVLEHEPQSAQAWYLYGVALARLNRDIEALHVLREAYRRAPNELPVLQVLADMEFRIGFPADALPLWQALYEIKPDQLYVCLRAGEILSRLGFHREALSHYFHALQRHPDSHDLWMAIAQVEDDLGDRSSADKAYRKALELRSNWAFPLAGLLTLHHEKIEPTVADQAQALLRSSTTSDADRALIGYAMGRVHDRRGEYTVAMSCWHDANAARRRMAGEADHYALQERVERIMKVFGPEYLAGASLRGSQDSRPLFIVGMPRSGTTLTEQIIAAHPQAFGCGELPDISLITRHLLPTQPRSAQPIPIWPEAALELNQSALNTAIDRYIQACTRHAPSSALRLVDKAPLNFFYLGLIALMFPQARVIWCRRDPRDIAISIYAENFALDERLCTRLDTIGHYIRLQEKLMRHWQSFLPLPILELSYESLVSSPESEARHLTDFAGLDWNPNCLNFHNHVRSVQTPSRWQVKEPVHTRSLGRWRNYVQYLSPLLTGLEDRRPDETIKGAHANPSP